MRSRQTTKLLKYAMTREIKILCDVYWKISLVNKWKTNWVQENIPRCEILQGSIKREFEILDSIIR